MSQLLHGTQVKPGVIFTRLIDVTPQRLFEAWTNQKLVAAWWGPYGFTNPLCYWDAKPGGKIYVEMTAPDGMTFPMKGIFHEVESNKKLVFTSKAFEDEDGNAQLEVLNTVTFDEEHGKAKFTLEAKIMKATPLVKASLDGMQQGWGQGLDKLEEYLKTIKYEKNEQQDTSLSSFEY